MTSVLRICLLTMTWSYLVLFPIAQTTDGIDADTTSAVPSANITITVPAVIDGVEGLQFTVPVPEPIATTLNEQLPFIDPTPCPTPSISATPSPTPSLSPSPSTSPPPSPSASRSPSPSASLTPLQAPALSPSPSSAPSSPPPSAAPTLDGSTAAPSPSPLAASPALTSPANPTPAQLSATPTLSPSPSPSSPCIQGCRCQNPGTLLGDPSFTEKELEKFGNNEASIWLAASWNMPDPPFRSNWLASQVEVSGSELSLVARNIGSALYGAEIRTTTYYGYGCVSACMKPSSVSGVISSLFTFTGPSDGINDNSPNQNEIDIEFEGRDTTKVQFNYHTDRAPGDPQQFDHELDFSLGFDASQSFNTYGFRWAPWGIEWEVNGNVVRTVENTGGVETPVVTADTVQKVMANIWIVSQSIENGFGGPFDFDSFTETNAQYKWIRYEKMDSNGCCSISPAC